MQPLALSIKQPWAWLIAWGFKDIENRRWPTNYRGTIFIHASLTFDREAYHSLTTASALGASPLHRALARLKKVEVFPVGAVIGQVDITDCVTHSLSVHFTGPYGFTLARPIPYPKPMPCKGQLKLFKPDFSTNRPLEVINASNLRAPR